MPTTEVCLWEVTIGEPGPVFGGELSSAQRIQLQGLVSQCASVLTAVPGCIGVLTHHIDVHGAAPVRQAPYRVPHAYRSAVTQELDRMQAQGVIVPSTSP